MRLRLIKGQHLLLIAALIVTPLLGTGCGDDIKPLVECKTLTVSPSSAKVGVGKSQDFVANCINSVGEINSVTTDASWTSNDETIATVSGGTASGVAAGTATITADYNGVTATASLEVVALTFTLQVTPAASTLVPGGAQQLTATANYSDGTNEDVSASASWTSGDATVATVDAKGEVTAVAEGTTDITAEYKSIKATAGVVVIDKIDKIQVEPVADSVVVLGTKQFKATATTKSGQSSNVTSQVTWTSSDAGKATIDKLGLATAVAAGTTTIAAKLSIGGTDYTDSTTLTVTDAKLLSVQVTGITSPATISIATQYTATAIYDNGTKVDVTKDAGTTWTSSDTTKATFSTTTPGQLEPKADGTTDVTATFKSVTSTALPVVVKMSTVVVQSIAVTPAAATIAAGTTQQFVATATMSDSTTQIITTVAAWQSSASAVATVTGGLATGVAKGTATITATHSGVSGTAALIVTDKVCKTLTITPSSAQTIGLGQEIDFTASCTFSDKSTQDVTSQVNWSSAPGGFVGFTGAKAKGIKAGSTQVTAIFANPAGSTPASVTSNPVLVVVTPKYLTALTIDNPPTASMPVGASYAFTVTGTWSDATTSDETDDVVWSSATATVASISNATGSEGLAIAKAAGTTAVTAARTNSQGTLISSNTATLTVTAGITLSYIVLAPASTNLNVGETQQFTATGHYSDGSNHDITSTVSWQAVGCTTLTAITNFTVTGGLVTAVSSTATLCGGSSGGHGRVMASLGQVKALARVKITATAISSVAVTCASPLTCLPSNVGYKVACSAMATYKDGTTGNITATASWNSTKTNFATAAAGGVITIVGNGTAIISATQGGVTSPITGSVTAATVQGAALTQGALTVSAVSLDISKGQTSQFTATSVFTAASGTCSGGSPYSYNVTKLASWSSSNTGVATVSNAAASKGLATGLTKGTSTISASFNSQSSSKLLTVDAACLQKVVITKLPTLPTKVTVTLAANGFYSDASTTPVALGVTVGSWSENCGTYTVDANWNLTVSTGNCTVTYTVSGTSVCGGGSVSDSIAVKTSGSIGVTGLSTAPANATINTGGAQNFRAMATFQGGASYDVSDFAAWSNNPGVTGLTDAALAPGATGYPARRYSHAGTATGSTTVSALYKALVATSSLAVSGVLPKSISITSVVPSTTCGGYPVGVKVKFLATVTYTNGVTAVNPSAVIFTSSNPAKLDIVSGNEFLTKAPSGGTDPVITATIGSLSDTQTVTVLATSVKLTNMEFTPSTQPLPLNRNVTQTLTVKGVYGSCSTRFDISTQVTSASSNSSLVDVSTTGSGTAIQTFNTVTSTPVTLSFIKDGVTRTYQVTVSAGKCYTSVAVTPQGLSLPKGSTQAFTATATTNQSTQEDVSTLGSWSSSSSALLKLNSGSTFESVAPGSPTVTFTWTASSVCKGGDTSKHTISGSAGVTTTTKIVKSVVIAKSKLGTGAAGTIRIPAGETRNIFGTATMTDDSIMDVTAATGTVWSSQQTATATISASGLLTGVAAGTTIVSVTTSNGKTANVTIIVASCGNPTVTLSTAGTGSLPVGQTRQYSVTATYAGACSGWATDEKVYIITSGATCNATGTGVASISNLGLATALGAGTSTLTATYRGQTSAGVTLTVVSVTLTGLSITPSPTASLPIGPNGAVTVTVSASYTGGGSTYTNLAPPLVSWAITDGTVVSVTGPKAGTSNKEYTLTGLKVGSTTFFAQVGTTISNTVTATVTAVCITKITIISPSGNRTWPRGWPNDMNTACTWSDGAARSCNPTYSTTGAIFDDNFSGSFASSGIGRVKTTAANGAKGNLVATVAGCGGNKTHSRTITVGTAALTSVTVPATLDMARGTTKTLASTGHWTGGTGAGNTAVTLFASYASNNGTIVQVAAPNPGSGKLNAQNKNGTALATANYMTRTSNNCTVTVSGKVLTAVTITAEKNYINGGTDRNRDAQYPAGSFTLQLKATGTYSDSTTEDLTSSATWSLPTPLVTGTTISTGGLLTTGTPSTAWATQTVKAVSGARSDTFTVAIIKGAITTIAIRNSSGGTPALKVARGLTVSYAAHVTIMGGNKFWATKNVTWASSVPAFGTMVASGATGGLFTAVAAGITNISASRGTVSSGPLAITVTSAEPSKIECEPATVSVASYGGTAQLKAYVTDTNGDKTEVTSDSKTAWKAINTGKADFTTPATPGLITGAAPGTAYGTPWYTFTNNLGAAVTIKATSTANRCVVKVY